MDDQEQKQQIPPELSEDNKKKITELKEEELKKVTGGIDKSTPIL